MSRIREPEADSVIRMSAADRAAERLARLERVAGSDRAEERAEQLGRLLVDLRDALAEEQGQVASLNQRLAEREWELNNVLSSKSWRWTAPFRRVVRAARQTLIWLRERRAGSSGGSIGSGGRASDGAAPARPIEAPAAGAKKELQGEVKWLEAMGTYLDNLFAQAQGVRGVPLDYVPLAADSVDPATLSIRVIAFYLPQFHPIKENDEWWGPGFTEWTNVSKAVPQFAGHYQPHLPGELGFYDLRLVEVQRRQIELARQYGIYGFCFHFYWFGGRRLLERPIQTFLENPDLEMPFCLCWANENWTRRWDGADHEVLIAQEHSSDDDVNLISALAPALSDRRYIRIGGRPLLIVYRVSLLPDPRATAERWRNYCRNNGLGEPLLVAAQSFEVEDPRHYGFDAAVEFPPHRIGEPLEITGTLEVLNPSYQGKVFDYRAMAQAMSAREWPEFTLFKTVCPGWDNEARKPGRGHTYHHASPLEYARWLRATCDGTLQHRTAPERLVFVNAWNEWGEGAHLEPDRRYGYGYLHATANVLRHFHRLDEETLQRLCAIQQRFKRCSEDAVIVHLYYEDLLDEIAGVIRRTGIPLDPFISVKVDVSTDILKRIEQFFPNAYVYTAENRGRDVRPFLRALRMVSDLGYRLGVKLHTKKTLHAADGGFWRGKLFADLMPDTEGAARIARAFEDDPALGLLAAGSGLVSLAESDTNVNNRRWLARILPLLNASDLLDGYQAAFPAGSMFWFRVSALKGLLALESFENEFEMEVGQVDGTLAHAVERIVGIVVERAGYRLADISEVPPDRRT